MILALIAPVAFAQADPVADAVAAMTDVANAYDTSGTSPVSPSSAARLRPATFEARLREASALLVAEGCTVDAVGWVGGAYRGNIADGVGGQDEAADELVTSVDLGTKVISAGTLGASTVAGAVGAADRRFRFVMDRDGSTFYVGQAARVQGTQGVFMGLEAECPSGTSPETALSGWFAGDSAGLDDLGGGGEPVNNSLVGSWSVVESCSTFFTFTTTWTVTGTEPNLVQDGSSTVSASITGFAPTYVATGIQFGVYPVVLTVSGGGFSGSGTSAVGECTWVGTRLVD